RHTRCLSDWSSDVCSSDLGALIQATDGAFYGTTTRGGAADRGTAFRMDTTGTVTILHSFGADSDDGTEPWAGLIQASDGNFYGRSEERRVGKEGSSWGGSG